MRRTTTLGLAAGVGLILALASHAPRGAQTPPPTFAADIAPVVYANCSVCHRPGQAAPFSLLSYEDVRERGQVIADVTADRYMPPWHAARAEGFPAFQDERRLTDAQIATIGRWVDAGMPAGDLSRAPKPPAFASGWALGPPDLIVKLPTAIEVPADGPDLYRNVMLGVGLPEDRWIRAIEFQPTARAVVHHALFFVSPEGAVVTADETIPGLGSGGQGGRGGRRGGGVGRAAEAWGGLGGWVPGITPRFFPAGIAQPLPKGSNLVAQLHLHPSGKAESEHGALAIYFTKEPPARTLTGVQVPPGFGVAMGIDIPAGEKEYTIRDSFVLPVDVEAFGARAHAHYLAQRMTMTAKLPDGRSQGLLLITDWDFGWQDSYFFTAPVRLPRGTTIESTIVYNNSTDNPRNPSSPPKRVRWGRESFDEMGSMTLLVGTATTTTDQQTLRTSQTQHLRRQLLELLTRRRGQGF